MLCILPSGSVVWWGANPKAAACLGSYMPCVNSVMERTLQRVTGVVILFKQCPPCFLLWGRSLELLCCRILQIDISAVTDDTADPYCSIIILGTIFSDVKERPCRYLTQLFTHLLLAQFLSVVRTEIWDCKVPKASWVTWKKQPFLGVCNCCWCSHVFFSDSITHLVLLQKFDVWNPYS